MADDQALLEKLAAIWKAICIHEGVTANEEDAENHIRATFGDIAAQSLKKSLKAETQIAPPTLPAVH